MQEFNFTARQSSAIKSLIIHENLVKVRYRNAPTAYRFEAAHSVIIDIIHVAYNVKENPDDWSIGKLIHKFISEEKLIRQPFNYKFDKTQTIGIGNKVFCTEYQLVFKTVKHKFKIAEYNTNNKTVMWAKFKINNDGNYIIQDAKPINLTTARKMWKNLHKRKNAQSVKVEFFD